MSTASQTNERSVEEIMSGGEPSLEKKRRAKELAWSNGEQPEETIHTIHHGDAREVSDIISSPVHLIVTSPPYFNLVDYEDTQQGNAQLGHRDEYEAFLDELDEVWRQ